MLANVVLYEENVKAVLSKVALGELELNVALTLAVILLGTSFAVLFLVKGILRQHIRAFKRRFACPSTGSGEPAAWYFPFHLLFVFSLAERKTNNKNKIKYRLRTDGSYPRSSAFVASNFGR